MPYPRDRHGALFLFVVSTTEEVAADSILDTASVAVRTIKQAAEYAKDRKQKVFRVTIQEVEPEELLP